MSKEQIYYTLIFALFIFELSFHFLPKILHEVLGVFMAAVVVNHVSINSQRFILSMKNMTPRKFFNALTNCALIISLIIILLTGVCISNYLFPNMASFELRCNMTIFTLHKSAAYVMMILVGVHVGIHWQEMRQRLLQAFGLEKFYQRRKIFFHAIILALSAVGVWGFFLNRLSSRILMEHIFATPATDLPAPIFMLLIVGGIIFFAAATFLIDKKLFRSVRR